MNVDLNKLYEAYLAHPTVTTDSRNCPESSIFFALKGEHFDGNQYAAQALGKGCALAVVDEPSVATDKRYMLVEDVLHSLQQLATLHRKKWGRPIVQITGTNGKTTTKELLSAVLSKGCRLHFTQGNLNNHIGVPLTLLQLREEHEMAVVETGANHPGEIGELAAIVQPTCGLITNVGHAHLEGFGSFDGVKRTKGELYDYLLKHQGFIFINAFDDDLWNMARERGFQLGKNALPYVEARVEDCNPFVLVRWREDVDMPWHSIQTKLIGAYNVDNVRAAITVGLHFGVKPDQINEALEQYTPSNNRSEFKDTGRNKLVVDAYNANPTSMMAALTNFSMLDFPHKMVILGDMRELGPDSRKEHQRIVDHLTRMHLSDVWLVGEEFASVNHRFRQFADVEGVKKALREHPIEGHAILIKGSNGLKLFSLPELL